MGGDTKKARGNGMSESMILSKKIADHAKLDPCGKKFLKYMHHVSFLRKGSSNSRNRMIWTDLKNQGALRAIMLALQKVFDSEDLKRLTVVDSEVTRKISGEESEKSQRVSDICNAGFSILSNAFALDYSTRNEAVKNGFIPALQKLIATFTSNTHVTFKHAEIITRAVKCAANLSNDSNCREIVLWNGVAISILKILEKADEKVSSQSRSTDDDSCSADCFVDREDISQLICACVRALRIMASDSKYLSNDGRDHLLKFGGLVTIINTLTWEAVLNSNEDFVLDVIRALTFLSVKIRSAPFDVVQTLIYNPEVSKVRCLVKLFESTLPDSKLYSPLTKCLVNFCSNKEISDCLGGLRIFHIVLTKLSDQNDEQHYHDLIKLLTALTRYSSFNQSHLATSPLIGSTLKILKSSNFKDCHEWLLNVYENLYEVSLSKLVQSDLVNHLCDLFREEIEDCDYDSLRKKISSLDDSKCSVHVEEDMCPFAPAYRCSSPSYQQIQEEMKANPYTLEFSNATMRKDDDSLSPMSSPAHSWSSGNNSPDHSDISHASFSSFSEDEGCCSPLSSSIRHDSDTLSDDDDPDETLTEIDGKGQIQVPPFKKLRLQDDASPSTSETANLANENLQSELRIRKKSEKSVEALKSSAKKIVGILNILYKCTHVKPFPDSILQITPILLGIILRGKVSLMPHGLEYLTGPKDDELQELSRRTFEVAYKILHKMCSVSNIFPKIIISGMIPVLHRLQEPFNSTSNSTSAASEQVAVVQKYCENLISRMVGFENDTAGWREGFIMRSALVNNFGISTEDMDQMIVNIPLVYQKHPLILRKFERKARSFTQILEMLKNSDNASFYRFEDCALALCSICSALGIKWSIPDPSVPVLLHTSCDLDDTTGNDVIIHTATEIESSEASSSSSGIIERVQLVLDDGTCFSVRKELLVEASPVFSAMFNGNFIEGDKQKVYLPQVSKTSVILLLQQIRVLENQAQQKGAEKDKKRYNFELSSVFELFNLADRFILEEIYERALNTVITKFLCPYSAPLVYAESVKLANLQKSGRKHSLGDGDLSLLILKYILTAEDIRMSERCNAIRKVFDYVMPDHVVHDLRTLIDDHMYKNIT